MPVVDAAALTQKIVKLEAAVASGKARKAVLGQRVAPVEADNARLSIEVATLQQLVRMLGAHERDLRGHRSVRHHRNRRGRVLGLRGLRR